MTDDRKNKPPYQRIDDEDLANRGRGINGGGMVSAGMCAAVGVHTALLLRQEEIRQAVPPVELA